SAARARAGLGLALASPARALAADGARVAEGARGNAVTHWNRVATDAFTPSQGTNPMAQSRTLAILHAAMHDALNAIERRFESYTPGLAEAPGASVEAAVATAARDVLVTLLPDQAALVEAEYSRALASVGDGPARTAGVATGKASAAATLTRRARDGAAEAARAYLPRPGPGEYQFTPPFDFAAQPGWGQVKPFAIELREHAVPGPQALASAQYARDLAHVLAIGGANSTLRTPEQSEIAKFWYEDSPLGWNRIANTVVRQRGLDPWTAARTFALVNFAMADGFIVGFEAKYRFRFWRPETAVRQAAADGNARTQEDSTWKPFLITPPVPDYPSTHTVLGWAAAEALIAVLGDDVPFTADSVTLPGVTRRFDKLSAAAEENGLSRVYAGIHFQHAVKDGKRQGRSVGRAAAKALEPIRVTRRE
ncbi:MAG TPA: phosphatase PAP2 family protein, partial [Myxococcaceae bacterium]|nr:phosphatase PAP2 family protein [Myxococcaceae bacterium]